MKVFLRNWLLVIGAIGGAVIIGISVGVVVYAILTMIECHPLMALLGGVTAVSGLMAGMLTYGRR